MSGPYGQQGAVVLQRESTPEVHVLEPSTGRELVEVVSTQTSTVVERELVKEVIEVIEPGPAGRDGAPGAPGSPGAPGPAGDGSDLPDMTIIFENGLL